jgi:hypothetical protein
MARETNRQVGGDHYEKCGIMPTTYIRANNLDFFEGNIVKYVTRHKDKNGAEDIKKVIHYAEMILEDVYGYKNGEPPIGLRLDTGEPVWASEVTISEGAPTALHGKPELLKKGLTDREAENIISK